jgi:hypothetical protein
MSKDVKDRMIGIVYLCAGIGLITGVLFFLDLSFSHDLAIGKSYGLDYAKRDCEKTKPADVCSNLKAEITPPPDWGNNYYKVDVYNDDREKFNASISLEIDIFNNIKLINYFQPNVIINND